MMRPLSPSPSFTRCVAWGFVAFVGLVVATFVWQVGVALLVAVVLVVVLRSDFRRELPGVLIGAGAFALLVAWRHRGGGAVCWDSGSEAGCDQTLDPGLWLGLGLTLVLMGAAMQAALSRWR